MRNGIKEAFLHDENILIEEMIEGREIECSVLTIDDELVTSGVGEIVYETDFYDYNTKYNGKATRLVIDPQLEFGILEKLQKATKEIFAAIDGVGMARVDFFLKNNNEIVFNEINTIPGFTDDSMFPKLWENKGIGGTELVELLIQSALRNE